jgi:[ribosomal protein S5]-alanine N-acetyltransferase
MERPPEQLEATRVLLRMPQQTDADAIYRHYAHDPHIVTYLAWCPHQSCEETRSFLQERIAEWARGPRYSWMVVRRDDKAVLGMLSIRRIQPFRISMSYVIRQDAWGQGYGTEAAKTVITWALSLPEIFRVEACCDLENAGSARVLEKLGMKREGILRRTGYTPNISQEPRDCYGYAITK